MDNLIFLFIAGFLFELIIFMLAIDNYMLGPKDMCQKCIHALPCDFCEQNNKLVTDLNKEDLKNIERNSKTINPDDYEDFLPDKGQKIEILTSKIERVTKGGFLYKQLTKHLFLVRLYSEKNKEKHKIGYHIIIPMILKN